MDFKLCPEALLIDAVLKYILRACLRLKALSCNTSSLDDNGRYRKKTTLLLHCQIELGRRRFFIMQCLDN